MVITQYENKKNSNTTFVKVKLWYNYIKKVVELIQIQHLLKLNYGIIILKRW